MQWLNFFQRWYQNHCSATGEDWRTTNERFWCSHNDDDDKDDDANDDDDKDDDANDVDDKDDDPNDDDDWEERYLHQTPSPRFFPVALIEAVFRGKVWICERQDLTEGLQEIVFRAKRCRFTRFLLAVITKQPQAVLSVNMEPRENINWVNTTQFWIWTEFWAISRHIMWVKSLVLWRK